MQVTLSVRSTVQRAVQVSRSLNSGDIWVASNKDCASPLDAIELEISAITEAKALVWDVMGVQARPEQRRA
jgi:hypothetical protein